MFYNELTSGQAGKRGIFGHKEEPTGQKGDLGANRDPGIPQRRGVLSGDEKIFGDRMKSAYANFRLGLGEQGLLRLEDAEIRERIIVIRNPNTDPLMAKQARREILESTMGLIPPLIDTYASPRTPKEEAVTEAYFVLDKAIDTFNLAFISEITGEPVKFTSYAENCMIPRIRNPETIEDISIPVHSSRAFRKNVYYVYQARKAFEQQQAREPSNDELYEEVAQVTKAVKGYRMGRDVFDGILRFVFIRPFDNLSQTFGERGLISHDTLEAFGNQISEETRDPDADVEGGVIFQEERQVINDGIESALSSLKPSQRRIIELRYGFGGQEHTLEEIGKDLDCSSENVRQREEVAERKLQSMEVIKQLDDYRKD